jgi:hypothetical protein
MSYFATFIRQRFAEPETVDITLEVCKDVEEFKDRKGANHIARTLNKKEADALADCKKAGSAVTHLKEEIKAKFQSEIDRLDKKAASLHRTWKKLEAQPAEAKTGFVLAKKDQGEKGQEVTLATTEVTKAETHLAHQEEANENFANELSLYCAILKDKK